MKKLSLLITATLGLAFAANAQDSVNFHTTIINPAMGTSLSCQDSIQFSAQVINLGPTEVAAGDSLIIVTPKNIQGQGYLFIPNANFKVGDTIVYNTKIHKNEINRWIQLDPNNTNSGSTKYVADGNVIPNDTIGLSFSMGTIANNDKYITGSSNVSYFSKFYYSCNTSTVELVETKLNVYPNPTSSSINFTHNFAKATTAAVKVLDLMGRVVMTEQYDVNAGSKNFNLDITGLANGSYFVELTTAEERGVTKFTVAK